MSDELKPCKHCGGEARFQIFDTTCNVECRECGIGTRNVLLDNYQECVDKWNRSADDAPINEKHVPSLKESTEDTQALSDSREQMLDYIWREITTTLIDNGRLHDPNFWYANIVSWLDRQAAITERELCDRCSPYATARDYLDTIDSLTAERDHFRKHVNWLIALIADIARKQPHTFDPEAPYETLDTIGDYLDELHGDVASLRAERDGLRKQLAGKQHAIDVQRDSFLKLERENRELQDVCGELERTVENMRGRE